MKLTDEQLSEALSVSEEHPVLKAMGQILDDTRRTVPTTQDAPPQSRISSHKSVR